MEFCENANSEPVGLEWGLRVTFLTSSGLMLPVQESQDEWQLLARPSCP